jgi:hypothetical protein
VIINAGLEKDFEESLNKKIKSLIK